MSNHYTKGQELELDILDTGEDDACVARDASGMVVLVRGPVTPGDRVQASVTKIKKNYLEARFLSLVKPSADRVQPVCNHFGVCGGCKWQHVDYARQLEFKRKVVEDALVRIGGFTGLKVPAPLACAKPYRYRNKVEFTFSNERFILDEELALPEDKRSKPSGFAVGFHRRGSFRKIIDIDDCHIATERSVKVLALTQSFFCAHPRRAYCTVAHQGFLRNLVIRHAGTTDELMVNLITSEYDAALMAGYCAMLQQELGPSVATIVNSVTTRKNLVAYGESHHILHGNGYIHEEFDGLRFMISPNSFFQTNSGQALTLYREAARMAAVQPGETLLDLYCGTGSITMYAGRNAGKAVGFELEASAIEDARKNASLNGFSHMQFVATDMKHLREAIRGVGVVPEVVITDPPRAGMHERAVEALLELNPKRIVYVSCHPGSLARDAKLLCTGDRYRIREVQPVDLFPHTFHIETIALLERAG